MKTAFLFIIGYDDIFQGTTIFKLSGVGSVVTSTVNLGIQPFEDSRP